MLLCCYSTSVFSMLPALMRFRCIQLRTVHSMQAAHLSSYRRAGDVTKFDKYLREKWRANGKISLQKANTEKYLNKHPHYKQRDKTKSK